MFEETQKEDTTIWTIMENIYFNYDCCIFIDCAEKPDSTTEYW